MWHHVAAVEALAKPAGQSLGMGVAPNKEGFLTVIEISPGGIAASSGRFMLGDMLTAIDGQKVSSLDSFVAAFSVLEGDVVLEVLRVDEQSGLEQLVEEVSSKTAAAEKERREYEAAVHASQDDDMMDYAINRSLSVRGARTIEPAALV